MRLRYEVCGSGPPVLALQGGPSNICDTLLRDVAPLTHTFTVVCHDYRGSGLSDAAPPDTYRFERLADDARELCDHLTLDAPALLAHSMGGFVALNFAVRYPERCARLALVGVSPCGQWRPMAVPTLRALGAARAAKGVALALRFAVLWSWRRKSPARIAAMYAPMSVTQEARRELRPLVAAAHAELPVENPNAAALMQQIGATDLRAELPKVRSPALVLYGTRDATMTAAAPMLASALPNADVVELADVGHEPFIEAPDATFGALRAFLQN